MTSLFSTDPFFQSPSYDESSPDLSILQELEMEYGNESHMMMAGDFLPTEEDVYSSPLSDASPLSGSDASPIPPFTVISPYDPIPTPTPTIKTESPITHHIPILPFQSVTATRTAKKRRRFAGMSNLRPSDDEDKDDVSIGSSDSQSSSSSPTTNKKRKNSNNPTMGKRERNKVSASKYRKRRKMYLDTLEEKTNELEQKYVNVTEQNSQLDSENRILKEQLSFLKSLLHTKGADMQTLEQTLQSGDLSTSTTSQQSSIFMFVLFSCFLLFNPMTWFTSTSSTTSLSSSTPITYTSRPSSVGHVGRNLLQHDETFGLGCEMEMEDVMSKYDFIADVIPKSHNIPQSLVPYTSEKAASAPIVTLSSYTPPPPGSAAPQYIPASEPIFPLSSSKPTPAGSAAPQYIPPRSVQPRRPVTTTASASTASTSKYVPLTGAPADLLPRRHDIDVDDPIRIHHVQQPVDDVSHDEVISSMKQPIVINETALASKFNTTEIAAVKEIIDMTKDVDMNDIKQLYQYVLTPLIRIMGETRAREAIQTVAQGILDIHDNTNTETSMTRSGQVPTVY